jgi:hypothetical protein
VVVWKRYCPPKNERTKASQVPIRVYLTITTMNYLRPPASHTSVVRHFSSPEAILHCRAELLLVQLAPLAACVAAAIQTALEALLRCRAELLLVQLAPLAACVAAAIQTALEALLLYRAVLATVFARLYLPVGDSFGGPLPLFWTVTGSPAQVSWSWKQIFVLKSCILSSTLQIRTGMAALHANRAVQPPLLRWMLMSALLVTAVLLAQRVHRFLLYLLSRRLSRAGTVARNLYIRVLAVCTPLFLDQKRMAQAGRVLCLSPCQRPRILPNCCVVLCPLTL